jgi:hypothetical protein
MTAPVTPLEALESLVDRLAGSGFTDASGRPLEQTSAFRSALDVLDERVGEEEASFQPSQR